MPVSSSTEHWIKPDALTINLNHFGDPDYLQVSVLAGAVVMAFKQDVIGYNAAHNYRTWPLNAANTYLETTSAVNVYAKLTRSEVNARALVVYDTVLRDIEGREITYAEDGNEVLGEANSEYFFVFLGQISSSVNSGGGSVLREWAKAFTTGNLDTNQQRNNTTGLLDLMFRPHYENPLDPNEITWIEALTHLGVAGGITMYADGGELDLPSIYAGLPIDGSTLIRDDNGVLMINPDIDLGGGASTWDELIGKPSWIGSTKPSYNYSEILQTPDLSVYAFAKDLEKYVTLNTEQTIAAHKNFLNGLSVGGLGITKSQDDVIYLDANLVVRGGITMYAEGEVDIPSILDSLPIASTSAKGLASFDPNFFSVDSNGNVSFIGSTGITEVNWTDVVGRPTLLSSFTNDQGFASTLGELSNVGSWADSAPTQGRLLYQEAGSSVWSYKNVSEFISQTGSYLPLSGGTLTQGSQSTTLTVQSTMAASSWITPVQVYTPNVQKGGYCNIEVGKVGTSRNLAWFGFKYDSDGSYNNLLTIGLHSVDDVLVINGYGYVGVGTLSPTTALDVYDGDVTANAYRVGRWNNSKEDNMTNQLDYTISYLRTTNQVCGRSTLQHIIGWANTLNGASETRYTIGSWRAAEGYGKMIFNVMSSTNRLIELGLNGKTGYLQLTGSSEFGQYNQNMHHLFYGIGTGDGYYSVVELVSPNEVSISYGDNQRYSDPYRWSVGRVGVGSSARFQFWNAVSNTAVVQIFTSGDFLTTGGITMYSDIRKKTKLQEVELTLQQIADAPLIEHYYNSDAMRTTHVGSIAQYWAGLNDWFCKLDSEGFYTMEIQNAALASAISIARELVKYESKTDKEIRLLKDEVKRLKKEIKILKSA